MGVEESLFGFGLVRVGYDTMKLIGGGCQEFFGVYTWMDGGDEMGI